MGKDFAELTAAQKLVRLSAGVLMLPIFLAVAIGAHWSRQAKRAGATAQPYLHAFTEQSRDDWKRIKRWWADAL